MGQNDPRKIIFAFLSELPTTIRTESLLFVILYAIGKNPPDKSEDFEQVVREYLITSGISAIGAVICSTAVIDHSFMGLIGKLDNAEYVLKTLTEQDPNNIAFHTSYLSLPLRRRHLEQALADWRALRATKLTAQKLQDFEDSQLRPQHSQ